MNWRKKLVNSFVYAIKGIYYSVRNERNMRIHIVCMLYMYYYLLAYDFFVVPKVEFLIILLANGIVISAEFFNTAIERAVDTATMKKNDTARFAKDCAAAAVLVSVVFAVIIGFIILWQPKAFMALFNLYTQNPIKKVLFIVSVIVFLLFIFGLENLSERRKDE